MPTIVDDEVRDLVASIEENSDADSDQVNKDVRLLIDRLSTACARPDIREKYESYSGLPDALAAYPIDSTGFAQAFDRLTEEDDFVETWRRYGVVKVAS